MSERSDPTITQTRVKKTLRPRLLIILMSVFFVLAIFGYRHYQQYQQQLINSDYFRKLYEISRDFNHELEGIYSANKYDELSSKHYLGPKTNIQSKPGGKQDDKCQMANTAQEEQLKESVTNNEAISYSIVGNELKKTVKDAYTVCISLNRLLSDPENSFSQLLLVTENLKIITQQGHNKALSIASMEQIIQRLAERGRTKLFNLAQPSSAPPAKMPDFMDYVDLEFGGDEIRIFIFPFKVFPEIKLKGGISKVDGLESITSLYLVAMLPTAKITSDQSANYNFPFVLAAAVLLVALWFLANLLLLPQNKVLNKYFQWLSMTTCYLLLISVVAVIIAVIESTNLARLRQNQTEENLNNFRDGLKIEVLGALDDLNAFRPLYKKIAEKTVTEEDINKPIKLNPPLNDILVNQTLFKTIGSPCQDSGKLSLIDRLSDGEAKVYMTADYLKKSNYREEYSNNKRQVQPVQVSAAKHFNEIPQLLTVILIEPNGRLSKWLSFMEVPLNPKEVNLSHRDYVSKLWTHSAWSAGEDHPSFYIQRLFNVKDGTLGTTMAIPLISADEHQGNKTDGYLLGADIFLRSTLGLRADNKDGDEPSLINDVEYMIVDRNSGDVLFHSNNMQSLKENLFHTNQHQNNLIEWVASGLELNSNKAKAIGGSYHGKNGEFLINSTLINQWAMVAFIPANSVVAYSTNVFLYVFITLAFLSLVTVSSWGLICVIPNKFVDHHPGYIEFAQFQNCFLLSCGLLVLWPGFMTLIIILPLSIILIFVAKTIDSSYKISLFGYVVYAVLLVFVTDRVVATSDNTMTKFSNYQTLLAKSNKFGEQRELLEASSKVFYESTRFGLSAMAKTNFGDSCQLKAIPSCAPKEIPSFSAFPDVTNFFGWLTTTSTENTDENDQRVTRPPLSPGAYWWLVLLFFVKAAWLWLMHHQIMPRLFGDPQFNHGIKELTNQLIESQTAQYLENPSLVKNRLILHFCDTRTYGRSLISQLRHYNASDPGSYIFEQLSKRLDDNIDQPYTEAQFPNMKCEMSANTRSDLPTIKIWDIEIAMEDLSCRRNLLQLIIALKDLYQEKVLYGVELYCGYYTFHRLCWHDDFNKKSMRLSERSELLSWAECLMDFKVEIEAAFRKNVKIDLIESEVQQMPELIKVYNMNKLLEIKEWQQLTQTEQLPLDHNSINYAMLHFESLYRFKWELCTPSEKLALFHLANGHQINPRNEGMIAHLAVKGLIKPCDSQNGFKIVNQTFSYFVLHAESSLEMKSLIEQSEGGAWKNLRVPFTLVILVSIVGLALISGQSILVIVGAITGILSALVGLTNSVNMLRLGAK